jgi:hypothetical protein
VRRSWAVGGSWAVRGSGVMRRSEAMSRGGGRGQAGDEQRARCRRHDGPCSAAPAHPPMSQHPDTPPSRHNPRTEVYQPEMIEISQVTQTGAYYYPR